VGPKAPPERPKAPQGVIFPNNLKKLEIKNSFLKKPLPQMNKNKFFLLNRC
jgi:hypothetical protein